jgi:parvulin-like peptidyl-prolyl isomerase
MNLSPSPALTEVAFAMKTGQRSGVIDLKDACYLMLVEENRPSHVKPLAEVRDVIEKALLQDERNRLLKQWIDRLKKKAFIVRFD